MFLNSPFCEWTPPSQIFRNRSLLFSLLLLNDLNSLIDRFSVSDKIICDLLVS